jgi:hypothetical protein
MVSHITKIGSTHPQPRGIKSANNSSIILIFILLIFCFLEPIHIYNSSEEQKVTSETIFFFIRLAKLRKREGKALGKGGKVGGEGESLNKCSVFGAIFESFDLILVKSIWISATLSFQLGDKHL